MLNQKQFDYVGVTKYHAAGITGKGVKILYADIEPNEPDTHASKALDIIKQAAPGAELSFSRNTYAKEGKLVDLAIAKGIHIIATSSTFHYSGDTVAPLLEATKKAVDAGILLLCSAGNNGADGMGSTASNPDWIAVAAADFGWNGQVERQDYSSFNDAGDVAFSALTNLETAYGVFGGTSCAGPLAAGQIALYMEQYKKDYGKYPTKNDVLHMVRDNAEDLEVNGRDVKTGIGLLKLPPIIKYKTNTKNNLSVKMIKPNGRTTYVHKDYVETYIKEKNYKLA